VDTLSEGEVVEVHREEAGGWLGIRPPADSFSWIFGRHAKMLEDGLAQIDKDDVASRIGSRMREDRNAVQVRLNKGEVVEVLGQETVDGQTWYKIAPPAGEFRWIHARHVARTDAEAAEGAAVPPVVTIPIADGATGQDAAPITLVADTQPATGDSWKAAPPGVVASPLATEANAVNASSVSDSQPETSEAAAPAAIAGTESTQTPSSTTRPVPEGLARQLTDLEMRLSRVVAEPPATWQLEPLASEAQRLLAQTQTSADRTAVQTTVGKIDRFVAIGGRYRQVGNAGSRDPRTTGTAGSEEPRTTSVVAAPITPLPGLSPSLAGPDGERYDAVGILRPVVSKRPGAPQFALLNERGYVVSFVTPSPDVNLQPYVGRRVGVTGSRGYIPEFQRAHVTAGRVAPLGATVLR
jgi:hypothetical protein